LAKKPKKFIGIAALSSGSLVVAGGTKEIEESAAPELCADIAFSSTTKGSGFEEK
jgi:hypothetical protein